MDDPQPHCAGCEQVIPDNEWQFHDARLWHEACWQRFRPTLNTRRGFGAMRRLGVITDEDRSWRKPR